MYLIHYHNKIKVSWEVPLYIKYLRSSVKFHFPKIDGFWLTIRVSYQFQQVVCFSTRNYLTIINHPRQKKNVCINERTKSDLYVFNIIESKQLWTKDSFHHNPPRKLIFPLFTFYRFLSKTPLCSRMGVEIVGLLH